MEEDKRQEDAKGVRLESLWGVLPPFAKFVRSCSYPY